jgi:membrane protease YdiL (CAAX protease family)
LTLLSPVPLLPDAAVLAARDLLFALPVGVAGLLALRFGLLRGAGRALPEPARPAWRSARTGAAVAVVLLAAALLPPLAVGAFRPGTPGWEAFAPTPPAANAGAAPASLAFFGLQSLVEELLFRAALTTLLAALALGVLRVARGPLPGRGDASGLPRFGRRWFAAGLTATAVQAAAFALLHSGNPHATPLALLNIGLAGAVLGWLYWSGGSLAGAWAFHALWNFSLSAFGLPVSGLALETPLVATGFAGAGWPLLSGGAFGPEGSLVNTAALAAVLAFLVRRSARRLPNG